MIWIPAQWFDGRDGVARPAEVAIEGDRLLLRAVEAPLRHYLLASVESAEPFEGLPRVINLPDRGTLCISEPMDDLRPGRRLSVMRVARQWHSALACALLLILLVIWLDQWAIGRAADGLVSILPQRVDQRVGAAALGAAERAWLQPSKVPAERQEVIEKQFKASSPEGTSLLFRRIGDKSGGFNAFALPGGTIVLLDGMTNALSDDELMWVLGHELGHVVHRDGMHAMARSFGVAALASSLWGDFSSWAVAMGTALPLQAHSREAERAADAYMREFAARNKLPGLAQIGLWEKVLNMERDMGADALPEWLSTHPSTQERLAAARGNRAASAAAPPKQ